MLSKVQHTALTNDVLKHGIDFIIDETITKIRLRNKNEKKKINMEVDESQTEKDQDMNPFI